MAPPKAVLFDIGGVCVISPMQAIVNYEQAHNIPPNWVNFAISRSSKGGAWQRAERGEASLETEWFDKFRRDLHNPAVWEEYHRVYAAKKKGGGGKKEVEIPPMPTMDTTTLFWMMMIISREEDPHMGPALRRLKKSGKFRVGALSNTITFPKWHPFGSLRMTDDIRGVFDIFVSSAEAGVRKPSKEAYEISVQRLDEFDRENGGSGIRAEDVVFLDDIGDNLKAAKAVGLRTIRVWLGKVPEAVAELEKETGLQLAGRDKARL